MGAIQKDWAAEMRRSAQVVRETGFEGCNNIADGNDELADAIDAKDAEIARLRGLLEELELESNPLPSTASDWAKSVGLGLSPADLLIAPVGWFLRRNKALAPQKPSPPRRPSHE